MTVPLSQGSKVMAKFRHTLGFFHFKVRPPISSHTPGRPEVSYLGPHDTLRLYRRPNLVLHGSVNPSGEDTIFYDGRPGLKRCSHSFRSHWFRDHGQSEKRRRTMCRHPYPSPPGPSCHASGLTRPVTRRPSDKVGNRGQSPSRGNTRTKWVRRRGVSDSASPRVYGPR